MISDSIQEYHDLVYNQAQIPKELSADMDELPLQSKEHSLSFAEAMNSLEGVPISKETAQDFISWKNGQLSSDNMLKETLSRYGFPVDARIDLFREVLKLRSK